jgi:hypothetical protein
MESVWEPGQWCGLAAAANQGANFRCTYITWVALFVNTDKGSFPMDELILGT